MDKSDFELFEIKEDGKYKDYWFKTSPKADGELCAMYSEQCLHHIFYVVYAEAEDLVGIKKQFPFNSYVEEIDNDEIKEILKSIIVERADHGNNK